MNQGKNNLKVEGIVLEKKLVAEGTGKAGKWKKIELMIKDINGSEIPVTMMQSEFSKDKAGNQIENTAFKGLETIMEEYKTVAKDGIENADRVSITRGTLGKNVYKGRDGQLRENIQFESRYAKRIDTDREIESGATVTVSGIVHKILPKNEGTELLVRFLVPNYKGELEYFDFNVTTPDGVAYFENDIESGQSLEIDVRIDYIVKVEEITVERNFGGAKKEQTFTRTKNLEIVGVTELEGENEWDIEEVKVALKELENRYQAILEAEVKKKTPAKTFGNGNTANKTLDTNKVESGDIPF